MSENSDLNKSLKEDIYIREIGDFDVTGYGNNNHNQTISSNQVKLVRPKSARIQQDNESENSEQDPNDLSLYSSTNAAASTSGLEKRSNFAKSRHEYKAYSVDNYNLDNNKGANDHNHFLSTIIPPNGTYSTQPDTDNEIDDNSYPMHAKPILKNSQQHISYNRLKKKSTDIKSDSSYSNPAFRNSFNDENLVNKLSLLSVTNDHSKDYSSELSSEAESDKINNRLEFKNHNQNNHSNPYKVNSRKLLKDIFQYDKSKSVSMDEEPGVMMISPLKQTYKPNTKTNGLEEELKSDDLKDINEEPADLSIFNLFDKNSKKFILKPATIGLNLKAQIFRERGMYPEYKFYLENIDETPIAKLKSNLLGTQFVLYDFGLKPHTAPQQKSASISSQSSNHLKTNPPDNLDINTDDQNHHSLSTNFDNQKMQSVDEADDNDENKLVNDQKLYRKEYVSVSYELNILGFKGPRSMCVIIPGMDGQFNREDFIVKSDGDSLNNSWRKIETNLKLGINHVDKNNHNHQPVAPTKPPSRLSAIRKSIFNIGNNNNSNNHKDSFTNLELQDISGIESVKESTIKDTLKIENNKNSTQINNVVKLINKMPDWNKDLKSFALNFNGRVTMSSVKNFQIAHETNTDYVVMQFGKVNKDLYTCDYSYPLCALQAFGIALTSLDSKIGCD